MRKFRLKEENIVVFIYDDTANSNDNPSTGTIIINENNVYHGVPKVFCFLTLSLNSLKSVYLLGWIFLYGRIIMEMRSMLIIYLLSSVETKLLSKVKVALLWIAVPMIVSSYFTLTMVV